MIDIRGFQCCFCTNSIVENKVDPVDMKLICNDDLKNKTDTFQLLYAHFDCLGGKVHESLRGYLAPINYSEFDRCQCCFCAGGIDENNINPVNMNIVFNNDMQNTTGISHNLYTHFKCLKKTLHKTMQGYLVQDDDED